MTEPIFHNPLTWSFFIQPWHLALKTYIIKLGIYSSLDMESDIEI